MENLAVTGYGAAANARGQVVTSDSVGAFVRETCSPISLCGAAAAGRRFRHRRTRWENETSPELLAGYAEDTPRLQADGSRSLFVHPRNDHRGTAGVAQHADRVLVAGVVNQRVVSNPLRNGRLIRFFGDGEAVARPAK